MNALLKLLGLGVLVLLALHVIGSLLAPILIPIIILFVLLSILAVPVAMIAALGWFVLWAWSRLEGQPV